MSPQRENKLIDRATNEHCPASISTLNSCPSIRFNLSIGAPCYGPPDELPEVLKAILDDPKVCRKLYRYNLEHGIPELVHTWAHILLSPPGTPLSPMKELNDLLPEHELMITPGANQAFMNALLSTCRSGDEVLLPLPYYFSHHTAIETAHLRPVLVQPDLSTMLPDPVTLAERVTPRTRALVISSPANPSGAVCPPELLRSLGDLCASHGIYLIVDEVYRDLSFCYPRRVAPSIPLGAHSIRIFSLSKSHGIPGLRVGALLYPGHLRNKMIAVQDTMATHVSTLSQYAALAVLRADPTPGLGVRGDTVLSTRVAFTIALKPVYEHSALSGRFNADNGGGYYLFLPYWNRFCAGRNARPEDDAAAVSMLVKEFQILLVPGSASGFCGFLRVSCASTPKDKIEQTAVTLAAGMKKVIKNFSDCIAA